MPGIGIGPLVEWSDSYLRSREVDGAMPPLAISTPHLEQQAVNSLRCFLPMSSLLMPTVKSKDF